MIYPLDNIKTLEITKKGVHIVYQDGTLQTIHIPDWSDNTEYSTKINFEMGLKNQNNSPITDHCI